MGELASLVSQFSMMRTVASADKVWAWQACFFDVIGFQGLHINGMNRA
jgi:hypothetical protein